MSGLKPSSRRRLGVGVAAVLCAALVGWWFGQATSPSGSPSSGLAEGGGESSLPSAPETDAAGVPVGFPDTSRGAAAATASYQRVFASTEILRPAVMRARIEAVAMPDYARQMLAANTPGRERIARGPIGAGIASGLQTLYASVPIGYRVESFSRQRAEVLTWGFTLLGNASAVEPAAYFGLTHTELRWSGDRWRIAETKAGFGPTPKLATSPGPLGGYDVIGVASRLKSYELAP